MNNIKLLCLFYIKGCHAERSLLKLEGIAFDLRGNTRAWFWRVSKGASSMPPISLHILELVVLPIALDVTSILRVELQLSAYTGGAPPTHFGRLLVDF